MTQTVFKVRGTVARYGGGNGMVIVEEAGTGRPVMMEAYPPMMKYIDDQSSSDMEEKYMDIDFIYDSWCTLLAIMVPSTNERIPAKLVLLSTKESGIKVFGVQEIIDTRTPAPMSMDEWTEAVSFTLDMEEINLRRVG